MKYRSNKISKIFSKLENHSEVNFRRCLFVEFEFVYAIRGLMLIVYLFEKLALVSPYRLLLYYTHMVSISDMLGQRPLSMSIFDLETLRLCP